MFLHLFEHYSCVIELCCIRISCNLTREFHIPTLAPSVGNEELTDDMAAPKRSNPSPTPSAAWTTDETESTDNRSPRTFLAGATPGPNGYIPERTPSIFSIETSPTPYTNSFNPSMYAPPYFGSPTPSILMYPPRYQPPQPPRPAGPGVNTAGQNTNPPVSDPNQNNHNNNPLPTGAGFGFRPPPPGVGPMNCPPQPGAGFAPFAVGPGFGILPPEQFQALIDAVSASVRHSLSGSGASVPPGTGPVSNPTDQGVDLTPPDAAPRVPLTEAPGTERMNP